MKTCLKCANCGFFPLYDMRLPSLITCRLNHFSRIEPSGRWREHLNAALTKAPTCEDFELVDLGLLYNDEQLESACEQINALTLASPSICEMADELDDSEFTILAYAMGMDVEVDAEAIETAKDFICHVRGRAKQWRPLRS